MKKLLITILFVQLVLLLDIAIYGSIYSAAWILFNYLKDLSLFNLWWIGYPLYFISDSIRLKLEESWGTAEEVAND